KSAARAADRSIERQRHDVAVVGKDPQLTHANVREEAGELPFGLLTLVHVPRRIDDVAEARPVIGPVEEGRLVVDTRGDGVHLRAGELHAAAFALRAETLLSPEAHGPRARRDADVDGQLMLARGFAALCVVDRETVGAVGAHRDA